MSLIRIGTSIEKACILGHHCQDYGSIWQLVFHSKTPFAMIYRSSQSASSKLRALNFICNISGSLVVSALCNVTAGYNDSFQNRESCGHADLSSQFSTLALSSAITAAVSRIVPIFFWHLLHLSHFEKVERKHRQQKIRRRRNMLFWLYIVAAAYALFVALFVAAIDERSQYSWAITTLGSLLCIILVFPATLALLEVSALLLEFFCCSCSRRTKQGFLADAAENHKTRSLREQSELSGQSELRKSAQHRSLEPQAPTGEPPSLRVP